jgi:hypothetical protein
MSSAIIAAFSAFVAGKAGIIQHFLPFLPTTADPQDIPALFALISAILTSILTFLTPSERAGHYHTFSNKFRALRDKARCLIEFDCSQENNGKALRDKLERLMGEKGEIDASHPIVPNWVHDRAYYKLRKKLENKRSLREERGRTEGQPTRSPRRRGPAANSGSRGKPPRTSHYGAQNGAVSHTGGRTAEGTARMDDLWSANQ